MSSKAKSSRASSSHKRPTLITKYKQRSGNHSILDDSDLNHTQSSQFAKTQNFSNFFLHRTFNNQYLLDQSFPKTSRDLGTISFTRNDRNLCLSKKSIYQKDYYKKFPINNKINISKQYDRLQGPNLQTSTIYGKDFPGNKGDDVERPIPQDLLKTGGPDIKLTSYSSGFPGYRCHNQYVKPTDRHFREKIPHREKSTYNKSFLGNPGKKDGYMGNINNLKIGYTWLGNSIYREKYQKTNPQNFAKHYKIVEKLQKNPDFKRQFDTTYRNNYLGEKKEVYRAKTKL